MSCLTNSELLNDKEVQTEIARYKWVESEKARKDIGLEQATQYWLEKFSGAWKKSCHTGVDPTVVL